MKPLLAYLTVGAVAALSAASAKADLLIYEPFDYSAGTPILGQTDTYATGSPTWLRAGTAGTSTTHSVASPGLTGPSGFPTSIGNAGSLVNADSSEYVRMNLPSEYGAGASLYYSLLLNVPSTSGLTTANTNPNANNDGIIAFNNSVGTTAGRPNTWAGELSMRLGSVANTFDLGIRASTTPNGVGNTYWTPDLTPGSTYLVVVKFTENATPGSPGVNSLWLNPSSANFGVAEGSVPSADGSANGTFSTTGSNDHTDSIIIGAGIAAGADPSQTYIDELRVGTTWADVTTVPEPSTLALAGFGVVAFMAWFRTRRL